MKLEEGKFYMSANGCVFGPLMYDANGKYPWKVKGIPGITTWTEDGHWCKEIDGSQNDPEDLVREVTINLLDIPEEEPTSWFDSSEEAKASA